ncbi:MAG TPA: hypothetical protein VH877_28340 [Polyangia bacterium]|nr:hypothetical protein [Polyangia bacterium]
MSEGLYEWWDNFYGIVSKGDNIPIVAMLFIVAFFLGWGLNEARRNDRLIEQGRRDEILKDMQR